MRYVSLALIALLALVHAELWFGKGGVPRMMELRGKLSEQQATNAADKARERELKTIVRELPDGVELWAGGRGAEHHASIIRPRGLILSDYHAYQRELVRIGGRVA